MAGFRFGNLVVDPPILLAPMEDVTNGPFRLLCKRIGRVGMVFTEFVSAMALHYGAAKSVRKMLVASGERPIAVQIFGSDPQTMAEAARKAEELGADAVDINMGCWVPKVCRTGSGAALLKDPDRAVEIVRAVVRAVRVPVSVKVRAGFEHGRFAAPDLARAFQDEGVAMLTLHARFATQGFDGEADWNLIERLRAVLRIPLVGNGDVRSGEDAIRMFSRTGCDGVMVGRAAIANPWALARIVAAVCGENPPPMPTLEERVRIALLHARSLIRFEAGLQWEEDGPLPDDPGAELRAVRHLRGQLPLYIKGAPGAAAVRNLLSQCDSYAELEAVLRQFLGSAAFADLPSR
ncbi:MAG: tRNA dihydrouridine synthase DusB [Fimbriimonadales bacterium]|nr:tRNA dihydrouridine synthase DusB [Fimbriimonadales bacterium]